MSQAVPLSKLLPQYNASVESMQRSLQVDNVHHMEDMLSVYGVALEGGASPASLAYLEQKIANRDAFNTERTKKDLENWMAVDKRISSYLGRDMNALVGGQHGHLVPGSKEPQLVQSLRVLSAFIADLFKKLAQSRSATLKELLEAVDVLLRDPSLAEDSKSVLMNIKSVAEDAQHSSTEDLIENMITLGRMTEESLSPITTRCVLECGVTKNLGPAPPTLEIEEISEKPAIKGGCGEDWVKGGSLAGGEGCSAMSHKKHHGGLAGGEGGGKKHKVKGGKKKIDEEDAQWLAEVKNSWLAAGSKKQKPEFRSAAAAQLYNLISAAN